MIAMFLNNITSLIMMQSYQNSYFNFFKKVANKYFEIDYWGLANKNALEQLCKN